MEKLVTHPTHPDIVKRPRRAERNIRGVIAMVEDDRAWKIATQMHAVEKATSQAKRTLIKDHLDHCLENVAAPLGEERRRETDEFRRIAQFL